MASGDIEFSKDHEGKMKVLGRGCFCVVFSGKKDGMDVALKRLQTTEDVKLWKREKEIFQSIEPDRQKNIVGYYGRYEDKDQYLIYIIMERCHATLKDMLEISPHWKTVCTSMKVTEPDYFDLLGLMKQSLNGLYGLHIKRIAHRDLKPSNILIKVEHNRLVAKIADFGLSKELNNDDSFTFSRSYYEATKGWMSPELSKQQKELVDERGDIFSMALVIFATLDHWSECGGNHDPECGEIKKYLYGATKDEAQKNIKESNENMKDQNLRNCKLIERHLIERMAYQDPACRPCAMECMMHPLFMSSTDQIAMIESFANATEKSISNPQIEKVRQAMEVKKPTSWGPAGWKDTVGLTLRNDDRVKPMKSDEYIEVVRLVRNKSTHKGDESNSTLLKELWGVFPNDESAVYDDEYYMNYFLDSFPGLLTDVWDVMKDNQTLLDKYREFQKYIHKPCDVKHCRKQVHNTQTHEDASTSTST